MTRVFIVEDHARLRETLAELINRAPGLEVCGQSDNAEAALECLEEASPELVMADLSLPGMNGFELIQAIRLRWPEVRCVILTGHRSGDYVDAARAAGAMAYIEKSGMHELVKILQGVMADEPYFPGVDREKASGRESGYAVSA